MTEKYNITLECEYRTEDNLCTAIGKELCSKWQCKSTCYAVRKQLKYKAIQEDGSDWVCPNCYTPFFYDVFVDPEEAFPDYCSVCGCGLKM